MSVRFLSVFLILVAVTACQTSKTGDSKLAQTVATDENQITTVAEPPTANADQELNSELTQDGVDTSVTTAKVEPSAGSTATSNIVSSYNAPEAGTVFTWRNNWANLPEIISYKVAGKVKNGDAEYLKLTSVKGFKSTTHAYYLTKDFSLKGYRDKSNKAVLSFKPPEQRYRFPMAPGDKWVTSWKQLDHKTNKVTTGGGVVRVIGWEVLDLPAGRFRTLKVRMPVQRGAPKGMTHYTWFSPELGVTVKEEIGGGILSWSQVLERVEYPG